MGMGCWPKCTCPWCGEPESAPDLSDYYNKNWYSREIRGTCRECGAHWIWLDSWAGWECVWPPKKSLEEE